MNFVFPSIMREKMGSENLNFSFIIIFYHCFFQLISNNVRKRPDGNEPGSGVEA